MQESINKTVIVLAGPTAVGKTAVALQLAQHFKTSVISADSRQCFRELSIGVARPTEKELALADHYFIASHSIQEEVTAASFEQYALEKATELFQQHDTIIVTGGTGLYLKAFCEGMDDIPAIPAGIRASVVQAYEEKGLSWLQDQLQEMDPLFFSQGEMQNPRRMMRALEVVNATGVSILTYQKGNRATRPFRIIKTALQLPREQLYQRINQRVDRMMQEGLLDEVKTLLPYRHLNALQTVGYTELFDYLDGKHTLERAVELIQQNTRHYAKRQMTWFKKDRAFEWFAPADTGKLISYCEGLLP